MWKGVEQITYWTMTAAAASPTPPPPRPLQDPSAFAFCCAVARYRAVEIISSHRPPPLYFEARQARQHGLSSLRYALIPPDPPNFSQQN